MKSCSHHYHHHHRRHHHHHHFFVMCVDALQEENETKNKEM